MRANAEVIILEDDPEKLDQLRLHFIQKRFHPLIARSASRAVTVLKNNLENNRPVLAIVDWDLAKAPDHQLFSADFLAILAREVPDCLTIVYSAMVDHFKVRSDINRAHPRAWLHDKREGDIALLDRVDRMLDQVVEDLRVRHGSVIIHIPTNAEYHHREAVRLVVHYPEIVTFHSDTSTKAVRRFGDWLARNNSKVTLISHGNRKYRLSTNR